MQIWKRLLEKSATVAGHLAVLAKNEEVVLESLTRGASSDSLLWFSFSTDNKELAKRIIKHSEERMDYLLDLVQLGERRDRQESRIQRIHRRTIPRNAGEGKAIEDISELNRNHLLLSVLRSRPEDSDLFEDFFRRFKARVNPLLAPVIFFGSPESLGFLLRSSEEHYSKELALALLVAKPIPVNRMLIGSIERLLEEGTDPNLALHPAIKPRILDFLLERINPARWDYELLRELSEKIQVDSLTQFLEKRREERRKSEKDRETEGRSQGTQFQEVSTETLSQSLCEYLQSVPSSEGDLERNLFTFIHLRLWSVVDQLLRQHPNPGVIIEELAKRDPEMMIEVLHRYSGLFWGHSLDSGEGSELSQLLGEILPQVKSFSEEKLSRLVEKLKQIRELIEDEQSTRELIEEIRIQFSPKSRELDLSQIIETLIEYRPEDDRAISYFIRQASELIFESETDEKVKRKLRDQLQEYRKIQEDHNLRLALLRLTELLED